MKTDEIQFSPSQQNHNSLLQLQFTEDNVYSYTNVILYNVCVSAIRMTING